MSGSFVQAATARQESQRIPRRMPGRETPVYEMPEIAAAVA
jgi:hypothetical protein